MVRDFLVALVLFGKSRVYDKATNTLVMVVEFDEILRLYVRAFSVM